MTATATATATAAATAARAAASRPSPTPLPLAVRVRTSLSLVLTVVAAGVLVLVVAWALVPGLFAPESPLFGDSARRLLPPSADHLFGTDQLGRDVFTRFVHGSATSLTAVAIALAVAVGGGCTLGLIAGFVGGGVDDAISRALEVLLAIPGLLLSLAVIAALGFGTDKIGLAVGLAGIPSFARVMRADVLRVRTSPYVEAARALGARTPAILVRHVLPHAIGPVAVLAVLEVAGAVLAVSALTFLGFGAPPPAPDWGLLVADGRNYLATAWWLSILPGLAIALIVVAVNHLARVLDTRAVHG